VIGGNHHFGHNREGDSEKMHQLAVEYGFDVEEIPEQDIQNEFISSAKIRTALLEGNIEKANAYLAHPYLIMGELQKADPLLKEIGLPVFSVRIEEKSKLIPKDGVYAVSVLDNEHLYRGLCFIKKKGPLSNDAVVEFYLFNRPAEFSGTTVTVLFHTFMREEMNFAGPDALKAQLMIDQSKVDDLIF
jgi:riboflavin kinase/FMN adenylyltransferase